MARATTTVALLRSKSCRHARDPAKRSERLVDRLGKYEILGTLGAGGMGVVYSARDSQLDRLVALKVLPEETRDRLDSRARMLREARAIAALEHANVATIYEFGDVELPGETGSRMFLAMEHVQGEDLDLLLRQGPLDPDRALEIVLQLLAGLEAAHGAGVVHRDLKPGNIRISSMGVVKILDFGLAKQVLAPTILQGADTPAPFQTEEAGVVGTVPYLAPEQARGRPVAATADLFSVGVILYQMLTGELPFRARNFVDFVLETEREEPLPLRGVEEPLAQIVHKLLATASSDRYGSAAEARVALEGLRDRSADEVGPQPRSSFGRTLLESRPRVRVIGLVALLVLVAVITFFVWRTTMPVVSPADLGTSHTSYRLAVLPFTNLTGDPGLEHVGQGLSYSLSSQMFSIRELEVVDPSISAGYLSSNRMLEELARDYGVNRVVTGQVQRRGEQLQVVANLVDPIGGGILASETHTRPLSELFGLQPAVAGGIGEQLKEALSPASRSRLERAATSSSQAYEDHLRALRYLEAPEAEDLDVAIYYLRRAIVGDPEFAIAHADLSDALLLRYLKSRDPASIRDAIEAAEIAVLLDPDLVNAQIAAGRAYREVGRSKDAADCFRRARELKLEGAAVLSSEEARLVDQPSQTGPVSEVEPLRLLGLALKDEGDLAGAEAKLRQASEESPEDWRPRHDLGTLFLEAGRIEMAKNELREAARLAPPGISSPALNLVVADIFQGEYRQAIEGYETLGVEGVIADPLVASNIGTAYYYLDDLVHAEEYYRLAIGLQPGNEILRLNLGDLLVRRGKKDLARDAYAVGLSLLEEQLAVFPDSPGLRSNQVLYLAKLDRCTEAVPLALRGQTAQPRSAQTSFDLARTLSLCGIQGEALAQLERAVQLGYPVPMIEDEADFESIRSTAEFRALVPMSR